MSFVATQSLTAVNIMTDKVNASDSFAGDLTFHIRGTFVGTITFWGMVDPGVVDGDRVALAAENLAGGTKATTTTAKGLFRVIAAGLHVQLEMTAYTSGTALIDLMPSVG